MSTVQTGRETPLKVQYKVTLMDSVGLVLKGVPLHLPW